MANAIMTDKLGGSDTANGTLNDVTDVVKTYEVIADMMNWKMHGGFGNKSFAVRDVGLLQSPTGYNCQIYCAANATATATNLTARGNGYYSTTAGAYVWESNSIILDAAATQLVAAVDYQIWTVIDECNDSSINATNFPTSTNCTEGTTGISLGQNASLISKDLSGSEIISFAYNLNAQAVASASASFIFTDGTNDSSFASVSGTAGGGASRAETRDGVVTVFLDWTGKLAHVIHDYTYIKSTSGSPEGGDQDNHRRTVSTIDLTGWSSFKIEGTTSNTVTTTGKLYYVREGNTNPSTTATVSASADAGSNYVARVNGGLFDVTSGSSMRVKLAGTVSSGEVITISRAYLKKVS